MARIASFPPIVAPGATVLILGSIPGQRSLAANEYYAHPQNAFWRIVGAILGFDAALPYAERTVRLQDAGIALWDVLQSCLRPGSLDSAIDRTSALPNDFTTLLAKHRGIGRVLCNGGTAHTLFLRRVVPTLPHADRLQIVRLPSTSPAHAALTFADKLTAWRSCVPHPSRAVRSRTKRAVRPHRV